MLGISGWHYKGVLLLLLTLFVAGPGFAMDAPEAVTIDVLAEYYAPVEFDHQMHVDLAEDCSVCHHHTTGTGTLDPYCGRCHKDYQEQAQVACQDCHLVNPFSADAINRMSAENRYHVDVYGLKGAYHRNCIDCHREMDGPTGCQDCHPRTEKGDEFYHAGKFAPAVSTQTEGEH